MLSEAEKKYLKGRLFNKNYQYVLEHRINKKLLEFWSETDIFLESGKFLGLLKNIFENFLKRLPENI